MTTTMQVRYEGPVPKTLRAWCDRNAEKVAEVSAGTGYCTDDDDGFAYDVMLRDGWRVRDDLLHGVIEPTVQKTLEILREVVPCDCDGCTGRRSA